jgi:hypothetical protein
MSSGFQQKKGNLKDKILVELQTHPSLTQIFFMQTKNLLYK